jgi:nonribosomal peptide synthetase DhbF
VTVSDILRESTVANLVKIADAPDGGAFEPVLPLRLRGTGAPLYCVHGADGLAWDYLALLDEVELDRPVYGLQAHGVTSASVEELAAAHVARVRRIQRRGPYHLCDHAIGAVVAQKMAALLRAEGHEVALVVIGGGDWTRADDLFGTARQAPTPVP